MAKRRFARKRGFKKPNNSETAYMGNRTKKHHRTNNEEIAPTFSPSVSGDSPVEHLEEAEVEAEEDEEVMLYKEPTVYDNLLKTLGSGSESLANAYKKRQREEEGRSDSDGDLSRGSKSFSLHEEVDDESDDNSSKRPIARGTLGASEAVVSENSDNAETGDDDGSSDSDGLETKVNGQSADGELVSTSSFNDHMSYKLSEGDLDNLSKQKWNYKWEMPAVDMPNCKWTGTGECSLKDGGMNSIYGLKLKLYKHWLDMYTASGGSDFHSSKERSFFCMCNSYRDILHHNKKPFYLKGSKEDSSIMDAYIMHSLNHIFRTRDVVTKNDAKVTKCQENAKEGIFDGDAFLDHGFTRPKVLILLPLSSMAFRLVTRLIHLTPSKHKVNVEHIDRFSDEFGIGSGGDKDKDEESLKSQKPSKPFDYQLLFGGNNNDHFLIGVKFTRRSIKLYSDFYSSDMIIASPLGLVTKIGEAEVEKEKDVDYLSSIEVLIIDHADVIAMQNWSHVNTMVEQLNRIPSKQHNTDIMRIRQWCLDGQAQFYRQTIILGFHLNPDIYALFNRHCCNFEGKVKLVCEYKGVLPKVLLQVRQVYERFDAKSVMDVDDARLEYFSKKVYPKIKDSIQGGIMLFVSSYFEFVRLRNFLKSQDASFCLLGEYTKQSDISRARVWFYHRKRKMMLYTERAHFYHRYKIRGIENLIIYSLPERKEFYPEIVNMLEGSHSMACTILFSSFDLFRLERIVGCGPAKRMVTSEKGVFVFC